jgi:hypothetical protein
MDTWQELLIVFGVIITVLLLLLLVLPALKRRGVDMAKILDWIKGVIAAVSPTIDAIKPLLPPSSGLVVFDKILSAAAVGVGKAEQLYRIGELEGDQRKQEAKAYILDVLKLAEVEITPEVARLVDGAIESEVLNLGHGGKTVHSS